MSHTRKQKRRVDIDPTWLAETVNDLREQGLDEMSIQCVIDELKEGAEVALDFEKETQSNTHSKQQSTD